MKLHSPPNDLSMRITAYNATSITIGERQMVSTFVITPQSLIVDIAPIEVEQLDWASLSQLHTLDLEVLLVGSGTHQQFPGSHFYAELSRVRIGLEVMTTPAACRTFNILAAEDRRVAALMTFDHG
ncbi:MAG: hypothetical protein ACI9DC_001845 [Gammaproteobacteria bacterium]|jgi:uncharacterized protein